MNVGILILLLNSRFPENSLLKRRIPLPEDAPFLNGEYDDFYAEWYTIVGVSIVTTCFFDAINPIFNFGFWCMAGCKRCLDRSCTCNMSKTHQTIQQEYELLYRGPEFQFEARYSKLIAMTFITLMYSSAIPILYPAGCALTIIMYWADKVLFLRHYRLPPRYGRRLAGRVVAVMEWAIILHLFFGLYMLSNPDIFTYEDENLSMVTWA